MIDLSMAGHEDEALALALLKAMEDHVLAKGELMGTYEVPE